MRQNTARAGSPFIVGPLYDGLLFVGSPVLALCLGIVISASHFNTLTWNLTGESEFISASLIGVFIHAHLFAVLFRSHGNPSIRKLYPLRFFVVPPLLFIAMLASQWVLVCVSVVATFWDVYHSGLQTFGLGRIYDHKAGNRTDVGRRLDLWLSHLLYAGPILAGATLLDHVEDVLEFEELGTHLFSAVPAFVEGHQRYIAWMLLPVGGMFLIVYIYHYMRLHREGYAVSLPKVCLFVSTAACSIYSWGFNTWGEAFFIMNFFHAAQYFALVWAKEQRTFVQIFRTARFPKFASFGLFMLLSLSYGALIESPWTFYGLLYPLSLVVSIMHFWYDGFIWSVRRQQV